MELRKRHDLKSSQIKSLMKRVESELGEEFSSLLEGKRIEMCTTDTEVTLILVDGAPVLMEGKGLFPLLKAFLNADCRALKHHVTVDMGAVPHVTNGADVMRPGIKEMDEAVEKGDFVIITEEKHGKPLAIGEALYSGKEIMGLSQGKVLLNVHHVGDKLWNLNV